MIDTPSLQKPYDLIWSGDPALSLPEVPKERETALRVARETGEWKPLLTNGLVPTLFKFRPIVGSARRYLMGEMKRGQLIDAEITALAFRLGLVAIENWDDYELVHAQHKGQPLADAKVIDDLDRYARERGVDDGAIVDELGMLVFYRAQGISAK